MVKIFSCARCIARFISPISSEMPVIISLTCTCACAALYCAFTISFCVRNVSMRAASARSVAIFFFHAEGGIRVFHVTGVQTCALPISYRGLAQAIQLGQYSLDDPSVGPGVVLGL